jgi:serine phosphatase RsbU (regulator of sigma subunit)
MTEYLKTETYTFYPLDQGKSLLAVLGRADKSMFAILAGPKLNQSKYGEYEKILLQLFVQLLDSAYQSFLMGESEKKLIFSLNHRILQMNDLIDTGIEISKSNREEEVLSLALQRAVGTTNASGGQIIKKKGNKKIDRISFPATFSVRQKIKGKETNNSLQATFSFQGIKYQVFLYNKESRAGVVEFDETDSLLLNAVTRQAHAAIENKYLQDQALEMEKVKQELAIAATIQQQLLPSIDVQDGYLDIAGYFRPADEVGGDYFDYFKLDNNRFGIVIADVSGHGVSAALGMTMLKGILHTRMHRFESPQQVLTEVNDTISGIFPADMFVTMQLLVIDPLNKKFQMTNAGHNPVLYYDQTIKKCEMIEMAGCALNVMPGYQYTNILQELNKEDFLLIYTDGINEAVNPHSELYTIKRLAASMKNGRHDSAGTLIKSLKEDLGKFTNSADQADDMVMIAIRLK